MQVLSEITVFILSSVLAFSQTEAATEGNVSDASRMVWWREARFGLFVHWGVYSVPAGEYKNHKVGGLAEWIMLNGKIPKEEYRKYAADFNPTDYDAQAWVQAAHNCGARYMVVTAKHHDGFALFDSKVSDWDSVDATPAKRDLIGELAKACRESRMPLGFHYSQAQDWWHPGGATYNDPWDDSQKGDFDAYLQKIAIPQIKELCERYGPVATFFFDTPVRMTPDRARLISEVVPPSTILNNRIGSMGRWDYRCAENRMPEGGPPAPDWELCRTMNGTWGFRKEPTRWVSSETLLRELSKTASMGGNYLLNVGPDSTGRFPPQATERLDEIGSWLNTHGDSIYGTRAFLLPKQTWKGVATLKPDKDGKSRIFLHVFEWPENGTLLVAGLTETPESARLLGSAEKLTVSGGHGLWTITGLPPAAVHSSVSVIELSFAKEPESTNAPTFVGKDGSWSLLASSATISGSDLRVGRSQDDPSLAVQNWQGPDALVSWRVQVTKPAVATLVLDLYTPTLNEDVSGMVKNTGQPETNFTIPASDRAGRRKITIGPLNLAAGLPALDLRLSSPPGHPPITLHSATLSPSTP